MSLRYRLTMNKANLAWQYNEFQQIGKDYNSIEEVAVYDATHADFRDIKKESNAVLDQLAVQPNDTVIDFGSGTGTFAIEAAKRCSKVFAVDISKPMLDFAKNKARTANIDNIEFCHAGFLTFEAPKMVDCIHSSLALHHLPDFWKGIALSKIHKILKPNGQLFLCDVVIPNQNTISVIQSFIDKQAALGGQFLKDDAEKHFRDEFSTYDWIMQGLLEQVGFQLVEKKYYDGIIATYFCKKKTKNHDI